MRNALLVSAALVPLLGAPSGAAERVTPIFSDTSWRGIWTHASGGCAVVKEKGRLPKSTVAGETAWKIQIAGSGGKWMIGIPRGNWSRMYVDDYLPSGVLELRIRGERAARRCRWRSPTRTGTARDRRRKCGASFPSRGT